MLILVVSLSFSLPLSLLVSLSRERARGEGHVSVCLYDTRTFTHTQLTAATQVFSLKSLPFEDRHTFRLFAFSSLSLSLSCIDRWVLCVLVWCLMCLEGGAIGLYICAGDVLFDVSLLRSLCLVFPLLLFLFSLSSSFSLSWLPRASHWCIQVSPLALRFLFPAAAAAH